MCTTIFTQLSGDVCAFVFVSKLLLIRLIFKKNKKNSLPSNHELGYCNNHGNSVWKDFVSVFLIYDYKKKMNG